MILILPRSACANVYNQAEVDNIATLARAVATVALSRAAFEEAVLPLIHAEDPGNTELTTRLVTAGVPSKGIDAVLKVYKRVAVKKAGEKQAGIKAKAVADAHSAAVAAHATAQTAAAAAQAAHAAAEAEPGNPAKANVAAAKEKEAAAATKKSSEADSAPALKADTTPTNSMWTVRIWSGAKIENPYSITNGTIKPNNTRTDGFVDLELVHRYVLSSDSYGVDNLFFWFVSPDRKHGDGTWDWFCPGQVFPDLDFRVGYVFNGSSTPTNLTVSTIAGGSDFYSDNSIGFPFWRWSYAGNWDQQATIELGGGFVTDKQFLDIHPNFFAGLGYQFHNKDWTWLNRFGLGGADVPRLRTGSNVATNSMGLPLFDLKVAPSWGTQITYSLSSAVNVQVGANAYFDKRASWNLSAGISVEPVALFGSFATKK